MDSQKPSILFVISDLNIGGAEIHICRIAPELTRRGHDVLVYTITHRGRLANELESNGVRVIAPRNNEDYYEKARIVRIFRLVCSALKLITILNSRRPDVVHFFLPFPYLIGGFCALLVGHPVLVMSRRSLNYYQEKYPFIPFLERQLHKRMKAVLANSEAVRQQLHNDEGVSDSQLKVVYNGIEDLSSADVSISTALQQLRFPGVINLTIVANLLPYKAHTDLVEALAFIKEELKYSWQLLIVGRETRYKNKILEVAASNGLSDKLKFLGERRDVSDILTITDIGILCSHEEGFSNSILEAMRAGLPLVVTDVGGNKEAVNDGQNGFIVPKATPAALAEAIRTLINDEELRKSFGKRSRELYLQNFTLERCVDQYEEVYLSLMDKKLV